MDGVRDHSIYIEGYCGPANYEGSAYRRQCAVCPSVRLGTGAHLAGAGATGEFVRKTVRKPIYPILGMREPHSADSSDRQDQGQGGEQYPQS